MAWFLRRKRRRVLVLGWDCADPTLAFDQFHDDMPTLAALMRGGTWGPLASSIPCITVPAWSSMLSSRDPGVLGIYGFRNRADHSYDQMVTADSASVKVPRIWDYLGDAGKESMVIGVPQTYPVRPLKGHLIAGFPVTSTDGAFAYPAVFKQEALKVAPDYPFDVQDFRTPDKGRLLQRIIDMTERQFQLVQHSLRTKPWDFLIHVNMGVDRMHHGFWRYHDPLHRLHEPGNPYQGAIRDYYRMIDGLAGQLISDAGDETMVLIVSDHGVRRMDGGVCINEWLWRNGWLHLVDTPPEGQITPFERVHVDWTRTRAWSSGGYYGRVFLNVAGREPAGIIDPADYESTRSALAVALEAIPDPAGAPLRTTAYRPQTIYQAVNQIAPDLLVYFGDLHWRAVGSLGHGGIHTLENDTGPDDANHGPHGLFVLYEPGRRGAGRVDGHQLMDIAPTVLGRLGVKIPSAMQGRPIT